MIGRCVHRGHRSVWVPGYSVTLSSLKRQRNETPICGESWLPVRRLHLSSSEAAAAALVPNRNPSAATVPLGSVPMRRGSSTCEPPPTITSSYPSATVQLHNLLRHGCLSYPQTWAFQQVLLHRRLQQRRLLEQQQQQQQNDTDGDSDSDGDCVVFLEHSPVYTLGRGADERHLTFVQHEQPPPKETPTSSCKDPENPSVLVPASLHSAAAVSEKLSRKVRGPGTARLAMDKTLEGQLQNLTQSTTTTDGIGSDGNADEEQSMLAAVEQLTESISPVIAPNGVPVYRVDRGGEVTFHGPSQLVVYPMLDLKHGSPHYQADLHWYLRRIEDVILQTLDHYGIDGNRDAINTGVWVGPNKIAAVGISSSRWITTHGFALNVDPDLSCFDTSIILPCGIEGRGVTSMARVLGEREQPVPSLDEVGDVVAHTMEQVFGVTLRQS